MPLPPQFLTVPHELQPIVRDCFNWLHENGFAIKIEHRLDHYPESATILASRDGNQYFYIFDAKVKLDRCKMWSGYGHSCSRPTYIVECIPETAKMSGKTIAQAKSIGVGLTLVTEEGQINEIVAPLDLTLNLKLPPLHGHRVVIKRALRPIEARFGRGEWKIGFEESCKLVEMRARDYMRREARAGNVRIIGKNGATKQVLEAEIGRMPLGALAELFCNKLSQSQVDSILCSGLKQINPDRISVAHNIKDKRRERRLRDNVGKHMWTINNMLKALPN
jgi:hypothetical protein